METKGRMSKNMKRLLWWVVLFILGNALIIFDAFLNKGWDALGILLVFMPLFNIFMFIVFLIILWAGLNIQHSIHGTIVLSAGANKAIKIFLAGGILILTVLLAYLLYGFLGFKVR